jgi:beta-lactam-binding protein with PASTA domain
VVIPDVVGQSSRAAEINLRRRGLEPGTAAYAHLPGHVEDQVIAQSPPPAAVGVAAPRVNMLFALSPEPLAFVMPNLVGRHLTDAARAIQGAGLKLANVRTAAVDPAATNAGAPTVVSKQSPTAGQKVAAGSSVELEVAK